MHYLYPLSADPPHFGHLALVKSLMGPGHKVTVAVLNNQAKDPALFYLDERVEMCRGLFRGMVGVEILTSSEPLSDLWWGLNQPTIVRGIRGLEDQAYEEKQAAYHRLIHPSIPFLFVEAPEEFKVISSSMIKGMVAQGFWVHKFVPASIERLLRQRILLQDLWGVTGQISTGKSTLIWAWKRYHQVLHVDVDALVRGVWNEPSPRGQYLRSLLLKIDPSLVSGESVILARLRDLSTQGRIQIDILEDVERAIRTAMMKKPSNGFMTVVCIEWALLAEMGLGFWGTHQTILTTVPHPSKHPEEYLTACRKRQLPWEEAQGKLLQASPDAVVVPYHDENPDTFWEDIFGGD